MKTKIATVLGGVVLLSQALVSQSAPDPWKQAELLEPAALAQTLQSGKGKQPVIIAVAFPVLYNNKHLPHAIFAGPGSQPAGIDALKASVAKLPKDTEIVVYCGCCPMEKCPNIRPSYSTLKELGFTNVRVLHVPASMATDWFDKGYPSELGSALK
jgi:hypothetical protein